MEMLEDGRGMDKMKYILDNITEMPEWKILMKKVEKDYGREKLQEIEDLFNQLKDTCNYDEANEKEDEMEDEGEAADNAKGLEIYIMQRKKMGDKGMMKGRGKPEEMMGE